MRLVLAAAREELGGLSGEVCGVGTVLAAARTAALIARHAPTSVVLLGTASGLPGGPRIGDVVATRSVGLVVGTAALGLAYVPRPPRSLSADPALFERVAVPAVDVCSSGAVTTDPELARRLADTFAAEHLEAFGVASACAEAGVPFVGVFGVAAVAGPTAHVEWLTHRASAQAAAREAARGLWGAT